MDDLVVFNKAPPKPAIKGHLLSGKLQGRQLEKAPALPSLIGGTPLATSSSQDFLATSFSRLAGGDPMAAAAAAHARAMSRVRPDTDTRSLELRATSALPVKASVAAKPREEVPLPVLAPSMSQSQLQAQLGRSSQHFPEDIASSVSANPSPSLAASAMTRSSSFVASESTPSYMLPPPTRPISGLGPSLPNNIKKFLKANPSERISAPAPAPAPVSAPASATVTLSSVASTPSLKRVPSPSMHHSASAASILTSSHSRSSLSATLPYTDVSTRHFFSDTSHRAPHLGTSSSSSISLAPVSLSATAVSTTSTRRGALQSASAHALDKGKITKLLGASMIAAAFGKEVDNDVLLPPSLDAFGAESENSLVALQWAVGSWTRRYLKDRLRASRDFESASIFAEVKFKAMLHLMRTAAATVSAARQAADDESELMSAPSFERHPIRPLVAVDLLHHIIASMHSGAVRDLGLQLLAHLADATFSPHRDAAWDTLCHPQASGILAGLGRDDARQAATDPYLQTLLQYSSILRVAIGSENPAFHSSLFDLMLPSPGRFQELWRCQMRPSQLKMESLHVHAQHRHHYLVDGDASQRDQLKPFFAVGEADSSAQSEAGEVSEIASVHSAHNSVALKALTWDAESSIWMLLNPPPTGPFCSSWRPHAARTFSEGQLTWQQHLENQRAELPHELQRFVEEFYATKRMRIRWLLFRAFYAKQVVRSVCVWRAKFMKICFHMWRHWAKSQRKLRVFMLKNLTARAEAARVWKIERAFLEWRYDNQKTLLAHDSSQFQFEKSGILNRKDELYDLQGRFTILAEELSELGWEKKEAAARAELDVLNTQIDGLRRELSEFRAQRKTEQEWVHAVSTCIVANAAPLNATLQRLMTPPGSSGLSLSDPASLDALPEAELIDFKSSSFSINWSAAAASPSPRVIPAASPLPTSPAPRVATAPGSPQPRPFASPLSAPAPPPPQPLALEPAEPVKSELVINSWWTFQQKSFSDYCGKLGIPCATSATDSIAVSPSVSFAAYLFAADDLALSQIHHSRSNTHGHRIALPAPMPEPLRGALVMRDDGKNAALEYEKEEAATEAALAQPEAAQAPEVTETESVPDEVAQKQLAALLADEEYSVRPSWSGVPVWMSECIHQAGAIVKQQPALPPLKVRLPRAKTAAPIAVIEKPKKSTLRAAIQAAKRASALAAVEEAAEEAAMRLPPRDKSKVKAKPKPPPTLRQLAEMRADSLAPLATWLAERCLRVPGLTQALGVWLSLEGSYGPHSHRLLDDTHVGAAMESEVSSASTVMNPLSPQQRARLLSSAVGARRIADESLTLSNITALAARAPVECVAALLVHPRRAATVSLLSAIAHRLSSPPAEISPELSIDGAFFDPDMMTAVRLFLALSFPRLPISSPRPSPVAPQSLLAFADSPSASPRQTDIDVDLEDCVPLASELSATAAHAHRFLVNPSYTLMTFDEMAAATQNAEKLGTLLSSAVLQRFSKHVHWRKMSSNAFTDVATQLSIRVAESSKSVYGVRPDLVKAADDEFVSKDAADKGKRPGTRDAGTKNGRRDKKKGSDEDLKARPLTVRVLHGYVFPQRQKRRNVLFKLINAVQVAAAQEAAAASAAAAAAASSTKSASVTSTKQSVGASTGAAQAAGQVLRPLIVVNDSSDGWRDDLVVIDNALAKYETKLRSLFSRYAGPEGISQSAFARMVTDCQMICASFTWADLSRLWRAQSVSEQLLTPRDEDDLSELALSSIAWIDLLLKIAQQMFASQLLAPAAAFARLLNLHLLASAAGDGVIEDEALSFAQRVRSPGVEFVFATQLAWLSVTFLSYASRRRGPLLELPDITRPEQFDEQTPPSQWLPVDATMVSAWRVDTSRVYFDEISKFLIDDARLIIKGVLEHQQLQRAFANCHIAQQARIAADAIRADEAERARQLEMELSGAAFPADDQNQDDKLEDQPDFSACKMGSGDWNSAIGIASLDFFAFRELLCALACVAIRSPYAPLPARFGDFCSAYLVPATAVVERRRAFAESFAQAVKRGAGARK